MVRLQYYLLGAKPPQPFRMDTFVVVVVVVVVSRGGKTLKIFLFAWVVTFGFWVLGLGFGFWVFGSW